MQIDTVELANCAVRASQYPEEGLAEFLLVGRSNVGKSSFINTLIEKILLILLLNQEKHKR